MSKTLLPTLNLLGQLPIRCLVCEIGFNAMISPIKNLHLCQAKLMDNNNESGWLNTNSSNKTYLPMKQSVSWTEFITHITCNLPLVGSKKGLGKKFRLIAVDLASISLASWM